MPARSTVSSRPGKFASLGAATRDLVRQRLLVGIPDTTAERKPEPDEKGTPPSNAVIGYTMEFGDPDRNIPARPFLTPGIDAVRDKIADTLKTAGAEVLTGDAGAAARGFAKAGLVAVSSVQAKITDGSFVPLSQRTIEARARRRNPDSGKLSQAAVSKRARQYLDLQAQGTPDDILQGAGLVVPLVDTGQLRRAITFVIRDK